MSFNLTHLTRTSVLALSAVALAVLSGCTNGDFRGASQSASMLDLDSDGKTKVKKARARDPFDSYYGSPKSASAMRGESTGPKIIRKVNRSPFKAGAPMRYVVKKGDTLWGIANKFLKNPAYWPEVWDKNQKVKNPHRIYPGDVLFIYQGRGQGGQQSASVFEKMVPQMRVIRKGAGDPISTLSPFLAWPRLIDENTIKRAPYIVDARDANLLIEVDKTVYVKNLRDRQAGGEYAIFNVGKVISDPYTGREYGREVAYNGFLEVSRPAIHAKVATGVVVESKRDIRRGDKLLYIEDHKHILNTPIIIPNRKIRGEVISLFDANMISGQTQVITINKGLRQGMKPGYTVGVYAPGKLVNDPIERTVSKHRFDVAKPVKVGIPPSREATAIVYKVTNDISYAVVTGSTQEIRNGYKIGNP